MGVAFRREYVAAAWEAGVRQSLLEDWRRGFPLLEGGPGNGPALWKSRRALGLRRRRAVR